MRKLTLLTKVMLSVAMSASAVEVVDFASFKSEIESGSDDTVIVAADFPFTGEIMPCRRVSIIAKDDGAFTLTRDPAYSAGRLFVFSDANAFVTVQGVTFDFNRDAGGISENAVLIERGLFRLGTGARIVNASSAFPGSVSVCKSGIFEMEDGSEIRGCRTATYAAAVLVGSGDSDGACFNMRGGLITACEDESNNGMTYGGAVYLWKGEITMSGGAITGNTSRHSVAGVNVNEGGFWLQGTASITNNAGYVADNVLVSSGLAWVYVDPAFVGRAGLGGVDPVEGTVVHVVCSNVSKPAQFGMGNVFAERDPSLVLCGASLQDGWYPFWQRRVGEIQGRYVVTSLAEAFSLIQVGERLELCTNLVFASGGWTLDATMDFTLAGATNGQYSISGHREAPGSLFSLRGARLRLENIALDGAVDTGVQVGSGGLVALVGESHLELGTGAVLRNAVGDGGVAVTLNDTASLVMEAGSVISNCTATRYASAVRVGLGSAATFTMQGGLITNCTCFADASLGRTDYGAAVYVWGGTFNMLGGRIVGNTDFDSIGGVNVYSGNMVFSGDATIFGNSGHYPDFYLSGAATAMVVGDFHGLVGVATAGNVDANTMVTMAEGATGAWCFVCGVPWWANYGDLPGYMWDYNRMVYLGQAVGSVDGVAFSDMNDLPYILPKSLDLNAGSADRMRLPIVLSGLATQATTSVALDFDSDALCAESMDSLVLFVSAEGTPLVGTWNFSLPEDADRFWIAQRVGIGCVLSRRRGCAVILR